MHHITLQQQAETDGVTSEELFEECARLGVPIVHGRVDRVLLAQARREEIRLSVATSANPSNNSSRAA